MNDQYLDPLKHFLAIKSISTQDEFKPEMEKARHFLTDLLSSLGFETKILEGKKHDVVFAHLPAGRQEKLISQHVPTVLIYGHYDVQPPEPMEGWNTPPFEPTIKDNLIYARGATDDKGQVMVHIMAVKDLIQKFGSDLPVNFKFVIEGEEEIGSISVESLVKKYKNLFKCDYILVSDGEMIKQNHPGIEISLRGLVYAEIYLEGSKQDLHSGQFGGVAENPANILSHIISELKDKDHRIKIPRFYDDVLPPTAEELKDYQALKTKPQDIINEGKLFGIGGGEEWYSLNERRWSRPTLDVNGITSGYQSEGSKTIIPSSASAKISMRLVPNQDPEKIYQNFVKFVHKLAPKSVKVKVTRHADALPYKAPTSHPIYNLVKQSLKKSFGKEAAFLGVGGSIGFIPIITNALKVPCILVGFGLPDANTHSPNEHFSLDNYYKGIETMVDFYTNLK